MLVKTGFNVLMLVRTGFNWFDSVRTSLLLVKTCLMLTRTAFDCWLEMLTNAS